MIIELSMTTALMNSTNHNYRLMAEYWQTKIRYENLKKMLNNYEVGLMEDNVEKRLGFKPNCPFELLREQQKYMGMYLHQLELRAVFEGISLKEQDFITVMTRELK